MRKFLVPEVVQTSALDCGPAALKSFLNGFGIGVSYAGLRAACQTGLDGTSIDTLELVAVRLGLAAEQVILPSDHLPFPEAQALPAVIVVQLPNRATHFVVVWARYGKWLQVMDPAVGRRWVRWSSFSREIYRHRMSVNAADWREFAGSEQFLSVLRARLKAAHLSDADCSRLVGSALADESWRALGALDAGTRLLTKLQTAGTLQKPVDARRVLQEFCANPNEIPEGYWSVQAAAPDADGMEQLEVTGAILVRAAGKTEASESPESDTSLVEVLRADASIRPGRQLFKLLCAGGTVQMGLMLLATAVSAAAVPLEALLFRSLFDIASVLRLSGQRFLAMLALVAACGLLLLLELVLFRVCIRLGRHLDLRFRLAFLQKIPRLTEEYFQTRLISDMAERSHAIHRLRNLPETLRQFLAAGGKLGAIGCGLIWLQPDSWGIVLALFGTAILPYGAMQPALTERDLRVRTHIAGLTRFYLDAMLGLRALWAHGAAANYKREQGRRLRLWRAAATDLHRTVTVLEGVQITVMFGLVAWLLLRHPLTGSDVGRLLLILYWATSLPSLAAEMAALARQYPSYRNQALRLLEPLGATETKSAPGAPQSDVNVAEDSVGVSLAFQGVSAVAGGHAILRDIDLTIAPGEHIAVVGLSGAGKSSLASLLLGFLQPASGEILCNGEALDVQALRQVTAWVDPTVQLWNRTLFRNVQYGSDADGAAVARAIDAALLREVLETLPQGLQTPLGESGGCLSGGEGERVRLARALAREGVRLVILDEPFRGLDREKREQLMRRARQIWKNCTLICITHDISETLSFDRVVVMQGGAILESGAPQHLRFADRSRYGELLSAEARGRVELWSERTWRRVRVGSGLLEESRDVWTNEDELRSLEVA